MKLNRIRKKEKKFTKKNFSFVHQKRQVNEIVSCIKQHYAIFGVLEYHVDLVNVVG